MKRPHWLRKPDTERSPATASAALNSATHVTTTELIGLRQPARKLQLASRLPATASIAGSHRSRFRGRGIDYSESRVYQPGDDIRGMDWRVTARAGKPHVKVYEEERERPVSLLLDFGPSLFFGSRRALKSVVAARVAALLGWATVRNGDRIGGLLFDGGHGDHLANRHAELPPRRGQRGALALIHELVAFSDPLRGLSAQARPGRITDALKRLRRITRPGSLVLIVSDFYDIDDDTAHQLQRLRQHNDVLAIQPVDPLEQAAPPPGRYPVTDGHRIGWLDTRQASSRDHYERFFARHHERISELLSGQQIPLLNLSTTDDEVQKLQGWFGGKRRRPLAPRGVNE